jgi:hypothetical protein
MFDADRAEFIRLHANVLDVQPPGLGDPEEKSRRWTMYRHYEDGLLRLNLMEDTEGIAKSGPVRQVRITSLGRLLLAAIGRDKRK